jgi:hypothetical protein
MMISIVSFIEIENRVISAIYRNLMIRARVVLVDKASGEQLADPVITIASPAPNGSLRIRLPHSVKPGGLLSEGAERARRGCRAKCRVFRQLTGLLRGPGVLLATGICQLPDLPPVV